MSTEKFVWTPENLTALLDAFEKGGRKLAAETLGITVTSAQTKASKMKNDMNVPRCLRERAQGMKNLRFEKFAEIREEKERVRKAAAVRRGALLAVRRQLLDLANKVEVDPGSIVGELREIAGNLESMGA